MARTSLNVYNNQPQAITVGGNVSFPNIGVQTGKRCALYLGQGGNTITLACPGEYMIFVNADILGTSAGNVQLQLVSQSNSNPQGYDVPGAEATVTVAEGSTYNVSFSKAIVICPSCPAVCNNATLSIKLNTTAATVSNINVNVVKVS